MNRCLSPSDNTGLPAMNGTDFCHYPILVEQMTYRSQVRNNFSIPLLNILGKVCDLFLQVDSTGFIALSSWKEVLNMLLKLVCEPVKQTLLGHKVSYFPGVTRYCSHLLARVVAELVHQCNSLEVRILTKKCLGFC